MKQLIRYTPILAIAILGLTAGYVLAETETSDLLDFSDRQARSVEFMRLYEEIALTPEQEAIKKEALEAIPAECCADNSAYTCCCPCNLSRTVWGLSAWLITERGADAETVRSEVQRWYGTVNENDFPGDTCYTGGCGKPFAEGGCGGMHPSRLAVGG
jgi:hypothetical protein